MKGFVQSGLIFLLLLSGATGYGIEYTFEYSGKWEDSDNWTNKHKPPMTHHHEIKARIVYGATARVSSHVFVNVLHMSDEDDGGLTVSGPDAYLEVSGDLSLGQVNPEVPEDVKGRMIVKDGARVTVGNRLGVGHHGSSTTLDIYDGTVTADLFTHNKGAQDGGGHGARTTLHGGTLTVNSLRLDGGVVEISKGILKLQGNQEELLQKYIEEGLFMINGTLNPSPEVDYTITIVDGYTVIQATSDALG